MLDSKADVSVVSAQSMWAGRIISALVASCLLFDSLIRITQQPAAMEGAIRLGWPESLVVVVGLIELLCLVLYLIPRTSVLGAILLTGHLGGAAAVILRLEDAWFLFPIMLGVLVWGGLFMRDSRLQALIPLRR